jgi:hypothetical protein
MPDDGDVEDRWLELICQPGFTTRTEASDISGRGVGLDAVRSAVHEVGGAFTATTTVGKGTVFRIKIPLPQVTTSAWVFRIPGAPFPVAIECSWSLLDGTADGSRVDLAHRLGLVDDPTSGTVRFFKRDDVVVGITTDRAPVQTEIRRLVTAGAPALGDIIVAEVAEGLLLHPERVR